MYFTDTFLYHSQVTMSPSVENVVLKINLTLHHSSSKGSFARSCVSVKLQRFVVIQPLVKMSLVIGVFDMALFETRSQSGTFQ